MNDPLDEGPGPRLRAVVLNYNRPDLTIRCARSLLGQKGVRLDLVVVDNWSNEGQLRELRSGLPTGATLVESPVNGGYAAGNNAGFRGKPGEYDFAAVVNNDAVMQDPFTLARLAAALSADPALGACSPLVRDEGCAFRPEESVQVRRIPDFWDLIVTSSGALRRMVGLSAIYRRQVYADKRPFALNAVIPCETINGCCFVIRGGVLREIGYLDEGTFLYCEEFILGFQLRERGLGCALVTQTVVDHAQGASAGRNAAGATIRGVMRRIRSEGYYARKYLGLGGLAVFTIWLSGAVDMLFKVAARPFRGGG